MYSVPLHVVFKCQLSSSKFSQLGKTGRNKEKSPSRYTKHSDGTLYPRNCPSVSSITHAEWWHEDRHRKYLLVFGPIHTIDKL